MKRFGTLTTSEVQQMMDDKNKDIDALLKALKEIHNHEKPNIEMQPGSQGCRSCTRIAKEAISTCRRKC